MNTTKLQSSDQNTEENKKITNISAYPTDLDIQKFLMLCFRWTLPSPLATVYSPSRWNATQCLLELMLLLLAGKQF